MSKLERVSVADLRDALADAASAKAAKRLMVALAYKDGVAVATLSDRYAIPESTLYYWLDRFEDHPVADAARDDERPGRPPALDQRERTRLARALAERPRASGVDADEWAADVVREFLAREFGVEYSLGHARRLRREHGPDRR